MFKTRDVVLADAELIATQRRQMFVDAGQPDDARMADMFSRFFPWVQQQITAGRYLGWLTSPLDNPGLTIAGAGMWLMEFPPHFLHVEPVRAYLLNFYVDPPFRGSGIARSLLRLAVEEAERRDIEVLTLHASKFGRPLYKQVGFSQTNEMMLRRERVQGRTMNASVVEQ